MRSLPLLTDGVGGADGLRKRVKERQNVSDKAVDKREISIILREVFGFRGHPRGIEKNVAKSRDVQRIVSSRVPSVVAGTARPEEKQVQFSTTKLQQCRPLGVWRIIRKKTFRFVPSNAFFGTILSLTQHSMILIAQRLGLCLEGNEEQRKKKDTEQSRHHDRHPTAFPFLERSSNVLPMCVTPSSLLLSILWTKIGPNLWRFPLNSSARLAAKRRANADKPDQRSVGARLASSLPASNSTKISSASPTNRGVWRYGFLVKLYHTCATILCTNRL
jgi:hypothetical protein